MMYWVFFAFFIVGVLVPDIVRHDIGIFGEERVEEIVIFFLGLTGFAVFLFKEKELFFEKKKREEKEKKLDKAGKDLLQSYNYIGEVNQKMDMLMGLALGMYKSSKMSKKEEKDFYLSVAKASSFLLRGKECSLFFVDIKKKQKLRDVSWQKRKVSLTGKELAKLGGVVNVKKEKDFIVISSPNEMNNARSYLIVFDYNKEEAENAKNLEILKVLASQALFLYSFVCKFSEENFK